MKLITKTSGLLYYFLMVNWTCIHTNSSRTNKTSKKTYLLLENLLDWSRSETGAMKYSPVKTNLKALAEESYSITGSMATQKGIKLILDIDENIEIYADENMVNTVIRNLVSNAIKYTSKDGTVKITGSIKNEFAKIDIIDNGIGISQENILKLFNFNKDYSTEGTEQEKGTGLGLSLCKELVEKNKGEIFVESQVGEGSTFSFTIPLYKKKDKS